MRPSTRRSTALLVLALAALASACGQTRDDRDRLEARQGEFVAALAARDSDSLAALFAADAVLHVANMPPIEGRDAIHRFYGNTFRFLSASRSMPETLHIGTSGDLAYATGSATNEFSGADGVVEYEGKYVLIWKHDDGDWQVALYSLSSNHPADSR
jgi:ketosteroid isomerase-like protein